MVQKVINVWEVKFDNITISKLAEIKSNSKYLIGHLNNVIKPILLILAKMSGYIKI